MHSVYHRHHHHPYKNLMSRPPESAPGVKTYKVPSPASSYPVYCTQPAVACQAAQLRLPMPLPTGTSLVEALAAKDSGKDSLYKVFEKGQSNRLLFVLYLYYGKEQLLI